jgi:dTMP kinase
MKGLFITFEGGEGTGKSTQLKLLAERLNDRDVVITREPGGTPQGEVLRGLLVTGDVNTWTPVSEALLNSAARTEHVRMVIAPALQRNAYVICDRFMDSTRAYQGVAGGVNKTLIDALEREAVGRYLPNQTLVFDLDPEQGLARAKARGTDSESRFERKGLAFHQKLRTAFLDIAAHDPARCRVIDASKSITEISEAVWAQVQPLIHGQ